jgi:hypothetical protein
VTAAYYRGADGIILVYDSTNPRSFANVKQWAADIAKHTSPETVKLLVGNKSDRCVLVFFHIHILYVFTPHLRLSWSALGWIDSFLQRRATR